MKPRPRRVAPPQSVLAAWEAADPEPIDGGQGTAFRAGDLVLKPTPPEDRWILELLSGLEPADGLRLIRPVRSVDGRLVVDGWSASQWLAGRIDGSRWEEALGVSTSLHFALAHLPEPTNVRADPWSEADRWAWGEATIEVPEVVAPLVGRIRDVMSPVDEPSQFVHADLAGNVLYHPDLPPAVIDVSPLWRPKRYADAIVVLDAVAWWDADPVAVSALADDVGVQVLLRAALFRIGAVTLIFEGHPDRVSVEADAYDRALGPFM